MNEAIRLKIGAVAVGNGITQLDMRRCWLFIALSASVTVSTIAQTAVDGDLGNGNTAEGSGALSSLTSGRYNTAMGFQALHMNTTGNANTATGLNALLSN